jgi:hypothetical protein
VFAVPPVRVEVTEHQAEIKGGPACEQQVKNGFSADVTRPVPYGPRLRSQAAYLNNYQLIPPAPTCRVLGDSYGMRPAFLGRAGHDHRPSYLSSENYQPPPKKRGRKQQSSAEKRAYALELIDVLVRGDRKALLLSYATELSWHGRLKVSEEKR